MTPLRRFPLLFVSAVTVLAVVLASCGIGDESEPRAVAPDRLPEQLLNGGTAPQPTNEPTGVSEPIYMLTPSIDGDSTVLIPVPTNFQGPDQPSPASRVLTLLDAGPEVIAQLPEGVFNSIPVELDVVGRQDGVEVEDGVASITLNAAIEDVASFTEAVAQIVWTITESPEVREVRLFDEEGEPLEIPTGDGSSQTVDRSDFTSLAPE